MENFKNNSMLDIRGDMSQGGVCPHQNLVKSSSMSGEASQKAPLTTLSFHTELSASDINRLLKIVSANDLS
ncbi:MAG: hypothetical protein HW380_1905 [Magnetococcales bacterium]|nr:hypothetical protein [Magnetococcales bacterium]HIJ85453.1 hypothetical protein [Magnetococcales bacterium]